MEVEIEIMVKKGVNLCSVPCPNQGQSINTAVLKPFWTNVSKSGYRACSACSLNG